MDVGLFQFWGITNKVTMNILIIQTCLYMKDIYIFSYIYVIYSDIYFLGYVPRNGMNRSCSRCIFNF